MTNTQILLDNWPLIVPLMLLEFGLMITAVVHILKHHHYRFGNRISWLIIVVLVQIIGPVAYFAFGRGDAQ